MEKRDINNKTFVDIIREMRERFAPYAKSNSNDARYVAYLGYKEFPDRLEAAAVRLVREERTEAIDEALAHAEDVRAAKCRNCTERAPGNAAIREALKELLDAVYDMGIDEETVSIAAESPNCHVHSVELLSVIKKAKAALAAPPRNCDVGTVDEQEERFKHYCGQHYSACDVDAECFRCPLSSEKASCEFAWAQMIY